MLEMWEELDMSTVARDSGLDQQLLVLLEERGIRYEIIDGALVVNAPPTFGHEDVLMELAVQLRQASPPDIAVLGSGYKFFYAAMSAENEINHTMGDITVVRRKEALEQGAVLPPVLLVEVQSPSTRRTDLRRKREIYAEAGVASYWLVEPTARRLTVLELQDGAYVETAALQGPGQLVVDKPFRVTVSPWGC